MQQPTAPGEDDARRYNEDITDKRADEADTEGMYESLLNRPSPHMALDLTARQYGEAAEALQKTLPSVPEGTKQQQFLKVRFWAANCELRSFY